MPPREPPTQALDADRSIVDAKQELAQAEARAEAARARAVELRRQAEGALPRERAGPPPACGGPTSDDDPVASADSEHAKGTDGTAVDDSPRETGPAAWRRRWLHRPTRKAVAVGAAVVLICAALTASGYVVWHHRSVVQQRQRAAEFSAAARQAVMTMMSIDDKKARDDVQRMIDDTTGQFKLSMMMTAEDMVKAIEQAKVSTKVTVEAVAVQSMTDNSAVVLIVVKSAVPKTEPATPPPRSWRLVADLQRENGQLKVSNVEFVP